MHRRHIGLTAKRRTHHRERQAQVDRLAITLKVLVFINMDHHIEITGGAAATSAFALAGKAHA